MSQQQLEEHIARQAVHRLAEQLVPLKLPFVIVVGLPQPGQETDNMLRASYGTDNPHNREFLMLQVVRYMDEIESGVIKPNQRLQGS